ncbi:MAG: ABC transporter transmembrane domain-containing protein, partial [Candidatus Limiplasma sp.]|nr:ABC transporter transmembrane domain-containing protein [Candidatus Limiplasma sp.]
MKRDAAKSAVLSRSLKYVGRYRGYLWVSLALSAVSVAATLYIPILTGQVIDLLIGQGRVDFSAMVPLLIRIGVLIALGAAAQFFTGTCNNRLTYCTVRDIRSDAFNRLQHLPISYLDSHASGDVVSRVITDVDQFADGLLMGLTQLFTGVLTILGTLGFMYSVNWII